MKEIKVELTFKNTENRDFPAHHEEVLIKYLDDFRFAGFNKVDKTFYDVEQGEGWDYDDNEKGTWWARLDFNLPE